MARMKKRPVGALIVFAAVSLLPTMLTGCVRKSEYQKSQAELAAAQAKIKTLEAELAQLRPLAAKARQLPISTTINRHAINAGYNLLITNESRAPLRLAIIVTANGRAKNFSLVVDGGKFAPVPGLAPHDTVTIGSEGYDSQTIEIK